MSNQFCIQISPECPVRATTYGYYPNLAANALFCAIFGLCGLLQLALGIKFKTWTWMIGVATGCLLEMAGYVGRLLMHNNPWSPSGFKLQIVALILSPSFIAAGIDLIMKHVALTFGEERSRIKPKFYTWVFIGVDVLSILVQAAGGGISASANNDDTALLNAGTDVIVVGIAVQIFQLVIFGLVALEYVYRLIRSRNTLTPSQAEYLHSSKFRFFIISTAIAYFTILIRCVYRMPEMAGGWGSPLQRDEPLFLVLDGTMIAIAAILMTAAHPGIFFQQLRQGYYTKMADKADEEKVEQSHAASDQSE